MSWITVSFVTWTHFNAAHFSSPDSNAAVHLRATECSGQNARFFVTNCRKFASRSADFRHFVTRQGCHCCAASGSAASSRPDALPLIRILRPLVAMP
jgi:hypothetical protein